ncbi:MULTISPECIES: hypothetical protein [Rhodococcus]|uniref:Uncharacterized protein n=1 Tax=Rhodococcus oxybenzonivorans TaxID=1990687 RepID=A0AAE5A7L0_9NOCA|nr:MULTISPECIES: hypothetical protein [Rhodococcus]MDV7240541.1 hypothetical protein [Rhodococcus oxybenzonivorans]MDV7265764.1 hypothetical protein [Rhodococcus oxybenzonivorans]MDV7272814.1 hypothetical protein [Rhodococcus oxybenzonivorans]MDV7333447.1 hypothetical protein [Rhodococcus oxybenzonivorans]MDV7342614.1 hypothetical protein [Rhodococcus oxybenzonivorans]
MTRTSMIRATHSNERAAIYGLVATAIGGSEVEYEISWEDHERDREWARTMVARVGIGAEDFVLSITPNHELPWTGPFIRAFRDAGATYVPVEQHGWDTPRFLSVLKRLPITVIFGLPSETLDALTADSEAMSVLTTKPRLIWARPSAYRALRRQNVECLPMSLIGPALGIGLPGSGDAMNVDGTQWQVTSRANRIFVSGAAQRASGLGDLGTGLTGTVERTGSDTLVTL